jgi:hypothetical protein
VKDIWRQLETILHMKVKDLIELLEEENPKAKIIFEFEAQELTVDELGIESSDNLVVVKLLEK